MQSSSCVTLSGTQCLPIGKGLSNVNVSGWVKSSLVRWGSLAWGESQLLPEWMLRKKKQHDEICSFQFSLVFLVAISKAPTCLFKSGPGGCFFLHGGVLEEDGGKRNELALRRLCIVDGSLVPRQCVNHHLRRTVLIRLYLAFA